MAGYIGKSQGVTQVDGYTRDEADAEHTGTQTFNRTSTDGDIVTLQKDGSTVGSIGTDSGVFQLESAGTQLYLRSNNGSNSTANRIWTQANPVPWADNFYNIGQSSYRYKDLYLSGGVYLGGTGSANYLDDYEEGTWSPQLEASGYTFSYNYQQGWYVKAGNLVWIGGTIGIAGKTGSGTPSVLLSNFPFTAAAGQANEISALSIGYVSGFNGLYPNAGYMTQGTSAARLVGIDISSGVNFLNVTHLNVSYFNFTISYQAA